jgi:tetratricopeptide (TPR) repeat protein
MRALLLVATWRGSSSAAPADREADARCGRELGPLRRRLIAASLLAMVVAAGVPLSAADPFYSEQLRRGERALASGDFAAASHAFRIAAFGLLEEPALLTQTLVRLGLAQAAAGQSDDFRSTFERIVEIDERFGSYRSLADQAVKESFEEDAMRLVAPERLRSSRAFAPLAQRLELERQATLSPRETRQQLERRLEAEPGSAEAVVGLARFELEEGRQRAARRLVARALEIDPLHPEANCLAFELGTERGDCAQILAAFPRCPAVRASPPASASALRCLTQEGLWAEAAALLDALPPDLRQNEPFVSLAQTLAEHSRASLEGATTQEGETEETADFNAPEPEAEGTSSQNVAAAPPPATETQFSLREELDQLRLEMEAARRPEDLDGPRADVAALAARYPDARDVKLLAAEIAYRGGNWEQAVTYFRSAGEPGTREPLLLFYFAIALFESGEPDAAKEALSTVLPLISHTPFVESYERRILGDTP